MFSMPVRSVMTRTRDKNGQRSARTSSDATVLEGQS